MANNAGTPVQTGGISYMASTGTIRKGDFVINAATTPGAVSAAAVGQNSLTQAQAAAQGAGIAMEDNPRIIGTGASHSYPGVRVGWGRDMTFDVSIKAGASHLFAGRWANPTELSTDSAEAGWTATSTNTAAVAKIVEVIDSSTARVRLLI